MAEAKAGGTVAVVWSEYNQSTQRFDVHLGGRSSTGGKLDDLAVFPDALDQTSPVVSSGAGRTMMLWTEGPQDSPKIRMTIINDASKAVIATLPLATGTAPSAAFDGKEWLAAWQTPSGLIRFALLNSDGVAIASGTTAPETQSTSLVQTIPAVVWSGKTFFLTWHEAVAAAAPGLPASETISVATINGSGVASATIPLDSAGAGLDSPSIAANGSRILVKGDVVNDLVAISEEPNVRMMGSESAYGQRAGERRAERLSHRAAHCANVRLPARTVRCPARTVRCPARTVRCPARTVRCPARTVRCPARTVRCPARTVRCPARTVRCPARTVRCPARTVRCPARTVRCPARTVRCPARTVRCPARTVRCPARTVRHLARIVRHSARTVRHTAATLRYPG